MTDEHAAVPQNGAAAAQPAQEAGFSLPDDDTALADVWEKNHVNNGAARGEDGKFSSPSPSDEPEGEKTAAEALTGKEPAAEGEGEQQGGEEAQQATETPLPTNWRGLEEVWEKIPSDLRGKIAERDQSLHHRLSEQGRQLSQVKPVNDVLEQNRRQFEGMKHPDGRPVAAADAVAYLFKVNDDINADPVNTLLKIADSYGVRDQIAQRLGGTGMPSEGGNTESALLSEIAELKSALRNIQNPEAIDQRIVAKLQEDRTLRDSEALISRLTQDKPLYAEIPEQTFVQFIQLAWQNSGIDPEQATSADRETIFNTAYDMSVHALPNLRAKVAAATPPAATQEDQKRVADARRANGVNVTSTSSGKQRQLTEDEELAAVWDKNRRN